MTSALVEFDLRRVNDDMANELIPLVGSAAATAATISGILLAWKKWKPQEESGLATAANAVVSAATTLVKPMQDQIDTLARRLGEQDVLIGSLRTEVTTLKTENHFLRNQVATLQREMPPP